MLLEIWWIILIVIILEVVNILFYQKYETSSKGPTPQAVSLHQALLDVGIKNKLEHWDGHKHIDISIPWAKLHIEIDGNQHYFNPRQMESDSKRTSYSAKDGFYTMRIPNSAVDSDVDGLADSIRTFARKRFFEQKTNKPY